MFDWVLNMPLIDQEKTKDKEGKHFVKAAILFTNVMLKGGL